jgi:F-type H+-transporting ATPase subunit alpha
MKFKSGEIASVIQKEIEDFRGQIETSEVGRVLEVGDGIARCYGLSSAMAGEMVEFPSGVRGLVFNLEENSVGVIILGDYLDISEGDEVKTTGELLSVPVGNALIGRVVDPLGNPLDGKGPIVTTERRPLETIAPGVSGRQPVKEPLQTGVKAIDSMTPCTWAAASGRATSPAWSKRFASTGRWTTQLSSAPRPVTRRRSNTWPPMPGRPWPSTSCTRSSTRW